MHNIMKEKLKQGKKVLGSWITIASPEVTEILSLLDFDWFLYDMEHGPITVAQLQQLLQTTKDHVTPIVRVPTNEIVYIKQALDVGGHGIMVPMVNSREDAKKAVSYSKYPPIGIRGTGARRASSYYTKHDDYLSTSNDETLVMVQIETKEAVNNFEEIITTDNVDAWFVGPNDLAASLGYLGQPDSPVVNELMKKLLKTAEKSDVPGGTLAFSSKRAGDLLRMGFRIMAIGSDDFFLHSGGKLALETLRDS